MNIKKFDATQKSTWYTQLYGVTGNSFTPLRGALSKAGRLYAGKVVTGDNDPVQYSCQQNFAILTTDGYWNPQNEVTGTAATNFGPFGIDNIDAGRRPGRQRGRAVQGRRPVPGHARRRRDVLLQDGPSPDGHRRCHQESRRKTGQWDSYRRDRQQRAAGGRRQGGMAAHDDVRPGTRRGRHTRLMRPSTKSPRPTTSPSPRARRTGPTPRAARARREPCHRTRDAHRRPLACGRQRTRPVLERIQPGLGHRGTDQGPGSHRDQERIGGGGGHQHARAGGGRPVRLSRAVHHREVVRRPAGARHPARYRATRQRDEMVGAKLVSQQGGHEQRLAHDQDFRRGGEQEAEGIHGRQPRDGNRGELLQAERADRSGEPGTRRRNPRLPTQP